MPLSAIHPPIRLATTADVGAVLALRDRIAVDLLERGLLQWDPSRITAADLVEVIDIEDLFVAGDTAGTIAVRFDSDPQWGPGRAGYLHLLMVDPALQGSGLGRYLVDWASRFVLGTGREYVRLDCPEGADGLHRFYEKIGFRQFETKGGMALFELSRDGRT